MSGFDLSELLPFYLDETDEQIAVLNDSLLRLEDDPADAPSLQEAFRIAHSIKGASKLLGFEQVTELTHHLESYFDLLRTGVRTLDRPSLDLCFACLDALRDFHKELRAEGRGQRDLAPTLASLLAHLEGAPPPVAEAATATPVPEPEPEPPAPEPATTPATAVDPPAPVVVPAPAVAPRVGLLVTFEPSLPWRDMKARLVLSRLGSRARVIETDPPIERFETAEAPTRFVVWVFADAPDDELRTLADVDGVASVLLLQPGDPIPPEPSVAPPPPAPVAPAPAPVPPPAAPAPVAVAPAPPPEREPEAESAPKVPARAAAAAATPAARKGKVVETLRVDVDRLDHLMNLAGELVINKARIGQLVDRLSEIHRGADTRSLATETRDRLDVVRRILDGAARGGSLGSSALERVETQFRRLDDNVSEVLSLLEQLREGQDALREMGEAIDQLTRIADGIQKGVLDTRMVPIGPLFERFRRVVRDLSHDSGKEVGLRLAGESTELDKRMIDELADPLIHMVRNAVDHGLESPDAREAVGKPRGGTVSLQAAHRGNSIVITVADDGRGIDAERIRKKIVAQGLVSATEAATLTERQLTHFIWHPGLSTAEKVTDISGRGVGMDIVKSRIEALNGTVDVRTELGRGTTFVIRLPLTLAILPSLLVRVYDEYYALPLDAVDEIVEVDRSALNAIHGRPVLDVRGRVVDIVELNDVFRWGGGDHPSLRPGATASAHNGRLRSTIVVVQGSDSTLGLRVDELVGIREVVLKSLERHFRPIPGLSGASILADGRVSLILDLDAIESMVEQSIPTRAGRAG